MWSSDDPVYTIMAVAFLIALIIGLAWMCDLAANVALESATWRQ